jgi:hypothetical protein
VSLCYPIVSTLKLLYWQSCGNHDVAGMRVAGMMRGAIGRPVLYNPQPQRELISVPVTDQTQNYPASYKRNRPPAETNSYNPNAEVSYYIKAFVFKEALFKPLYQNGQLCLW